MNRIAFGMLLALVACAEKRPVLGAMPPEVKGRIDRIVAFELPDSGGILANGTPLDTSGVEAELRTVFASWPPELRAAIVWENPNRPAAIVWALKRATENAGGHLYDAELSEWPRGFGPNPDYVTVPRQ